MIRRQPKAPDLHEPVHAVHLQVTLEEVAGSGDRMIRRFVRRVKDDGVLREASARRHYIKPSAERRSKRRPRAKLP